jgi:hypothetical protein
LSETIENETGAARAKFFLMDNAKQHLVDLETSECLTPFGLVAQSMRKQEVAKTTDLAGSKHYNRYLESFGV